MGRFYIAVHLPCKWSVHVGKYTIDGIGMGVLLASINFFQVTFWYSYLQLPDVSFFCRWIFPLSHLPLRHLKSHKPSPNSRTAARNSQNDYFGIIWIYHIWLLEQLAGPMLFFVQSCISHHLPRFFTNLSIVSLVFTCQANKTPLSRLRYEILLLCLETRPMKSSHILVSKVAGLIANRFWLTAASKSGL